MSNAIAPLAARSATPPHDRAPTRRFAIIGAGTMGRALATGMLRSACVAPPHLAVASRDGERAAQLAADLGARHAASSRDACRDADVVLVCVKPKDMYLLLSDLAATDAFERRPLLVSIAAGVSLESIEQVVGPEVPAVRAMPNTPSCIGHGMTVIAGGRRATAEHLATAEEIFASVGRVLALDERHLDAVTAVSASGPAFIYLIVEALADGGVMCGLTRQTATELVAQMTLGAAAMVLASGKHPAQLKDDVTTPGGCTIAGLLALEERHIRSALAHAVQTTTRVAAGLGR